MGLLKNAPTSGQGSPFKAGRMQPLELETDDSDYYDDENNSAGDDDEDPHLQGAGGDLTSAVLGIIKGMVGPAILYLPHGFASAGYLVALPLICITTAMYLYSSHCLLEAWRIESDRSYNAIDTQDIEGSSLKDTANGSSGNGARRRTSKKGGRRPTRLSYPELAERALGTTGSILVQIGIALMQSGVCLTYLIFVPQNLHASFLQLFGLDVSAETWLWFMVVVQIPLSWIRDIRKLTCTNAAANTMILYGLLMCLSYALKEAMSKPIIIADSDTAFQEVNNGTVSADSEEAKAQVSLEAAASGPIGIMFQHLTHLQAFQSTWYLFIGTSVLMFEGSITLLVPLQEAVETRQDRVRFPYVYQRVILGIISFYVVFGMICWASFGQDVNVVLTTSLPEGFGATSVQLAYSVAVVFTFPLQNFPSLEIATKSIAKGLEHGFGVAPSSIWVSRNLWSSILVCFLAVLGALTMNSLDKVVSLMGSLLGCPIAFVFPPLIHWKVLEAYSNGDDTVVDASRHGPRPGHAIVATLGVLAMIFAATTTVLEW